MFQYINLLYDESFIKQNEEKFRKNILQIISIIVLEMTVLFKICKNVGACVYVEYPFASIYKML